MTIHQKKPAKTPAAPSTASIEKFISQAPDAGAQVATECEEEMTQISLRISKADLAAIDKAAKGRRIPRASFIRQAVFQVIEAG